MRLSSLLNLGLIAVGAAASIKTLRRRHRWEQSNGQTYIVLDYDDALAVSVRAGMPLPEFLCEAQRHGATHLSLPELTLHRLMAAGRIVPSVPAQRLPTSAAMSRWFYLAGAEPDLMQHLADELRARVPWSNAQLLTEPATAASDPTYTLAVAGDLPTLAEMGLGFEGRMAAVIREAGLGVVPRPVSFAWPEDRLIERTMIQVAGLGARIVAFDGDLILGHEMHLDTTVACLERLGLHFAYFCETRHQKGDWFLAKRLAPRGQVILAHAFTPAAMVPEDFHSAAHHWGMLAHARGIRLCYINVFRRIHATEPLECLRYLQHVRKNLDAFDGSVPEVLPPPGRESLALSGLAAAGAVALAGTQSLGLREPAALAASLASAAGAAALPFVDRPRGSLEQAYPPSYAPKLLALAANAAGPVAAASLSLDAGRAAPLAALAAGGWVLAGLAATSAALLSGQDYQQRIEAYRSLNADLFLPLAGTVLREVDDPRRKAAALAGLGLGWLLANRVAPDLLGAMDKDLPAGHTHHLSAAQRLVGDALIALGTRPGRKWAGVGLAGLAAAHAFRRAKRPELALAAALAGALGNAMMLASFRRPERPLTETVPMVGQSWAVWAGLGLALSLLAWRER